MAVFLQGYYAARVVSTYAQSSCGHLSCPLPHWCCLYAPTQPESITVHPNAAQGITHLRVLALWSTFAVVSAELSAMLGETPIEDPDGAYLWLRDLLPCRVVVLPKYFQVSHPESCCVSQMRATRLRCSLWRATALGCLRSACGLTRMVGNGDCRRCRLGG